MNIKQKKSDVSKPQEKNTNKIRDNYTKNQLQFLILEFKHNCFFFFNKF